LRAARWAVDAPPGFDDEGTKVNVVMSTPPEHDFPTWARFCASAGELSTMMRSRRARATITALRRVPVGPAVARDPVEPSQMFIL
jgi:hypothetical protein